MNKELIINKIKNKQEIYKLKRADKKFCDASIIELPKVSANKFTVKELPSDTDESIYRTLVLNTYNWMDSHDDVHIDGVFTKSLKENKKNVLHLHDHINQVVAKVGEFVDVYESKIDWRTLGVDLDGQTTALLGDSEIIKGYNQTVFEGYKRGKLNQHSVGMYYMKMEMAANLPEYEEEYKAWLKYYPSIANKERADEMGYFFAITEAKLVEGSVVTEGSNRLTPTLDNKSLVNEILEKHPNVKNYSQLCEQIALNSRKPSPDTSRKKSRIKQKYLFN